MILIGTLVNWLDPGLNYYSAEDRYSALSTIYKVVDIDEENNTALIVNEEEPFNEVEVYLQELLTL